MGFPVACSRLFGRLSNRFVVGVVVVVVVAVVVVVCADSYAPSTREVRRHARLSRRSPTSANQEPTRHGDWRLLRIDRAMWYTDDSGVKRDTVNVAGGPRELAISDNDMVTRAESRLQLLGTLHAHILYLVTNGSASDGGRHHSRCNICTQSRC